MTGRLHLAEAASNKEIEQQLAKPWSEDQVAEAFTSTLAGWKARRRAKRMKGNCSLMKLKHPHHLAGAVDLRGAACGCTGQGLVCPAQLAGMLMPDSAMNVIF